VIRIKITDLPMVGLQLLSNCFIIGTTNLYMDTINELPSQETTITHELESIVQYEPASGGQRLLNFVVDNLLMRFGLTYLTTYLLVYILKFVAPDYLLKLAYDETRFDLILMAYLLGIFNYLIYYTICEKGFRGYTLGKLISGTRAIREDGAELTIKDAFLRSLSRLVPFEAFSALWGTPWHDSWTKTTVIKSR
jgi:uncharacterized RDD family membrane protein YckC